MAVDADPANRKLMASMTPAHRKPGHQQAHGRPTRRTRQVCWNVLCHVGVSRKKPAINWYAQALDSCRSAPPDQLETQPTNNNG